MHPLIRPAQPGDASAAAPLLLEAMGTLANKFTGYASVASKIQVFEHFFRLPANQYSFENSLVLEVEGKVGGMSNGYDGSRLAELRAGFLEYIQRYFNVSFEAIEDETETGEFYIDCICVDPQYQGQGMGTLLLNSALDRGKQLGLEKSGLLVHHENLKAKRFYNRMGFKEVKRKRFLGDDYIHMQFSYDF